ncbi:type I methionyl aminopeptidase [Marinicella sp. W31]|uniref:type I methionyl aminopeptidase n=1 Tax=Marinicella sp. W31 TaxID=3023713 RepID=UPI003756D203
MIKTAEQIECMRTAGKLTAQVLESLDGLIQPGITTLDIDAHCAQFIRERLQARPASLGQYGYPYCVNTSVNHEVCHGMPSEKKLKKGDIVNVDVTVEKNGYMGDSSKMFAVGDIAPHAEKLIRITQECLYDAIRTVRPGASLGDIGHAIQTRAERNRYSVVREYCGHGIGTQMHEAPQVRHYGKAKSGLCLEAGMTFTIEPMINQGKRFIREIRKNDWGVAVTKDRRLSAQWEHTILVTEVGYEVLTIREEERGLI